MPMKTPDRIPGRASAPGAVFPGAALLHAGASPTGEVQRPAPGDGPPGEGLPPPVFGECCPVSGRDGSPRRHLPLFLLAALTGALAGSVGGLFHLAADGVDSLRLAAVNLADKAGWGAALAASVAASALLAVAALALVRRFAPEAGGSGIHEIEGALGGLRPLRWARVLLVKFPAGVLALGSGMALGREGPTIQMGGALGRGVAELTGHPAAYVRHCLVAAGAGAGLTAAFNAPLAGVLFVVEEMREEFRFDFVSFHCVVIACAAATAASRLVSGGAPAIPMPVLPMPGLYDLTLFLALGVSVGAGGAAFNASLFRTIDLFDGLTPRGRLAAALAVGGLAGFLALTIPGAAGGGDAVIASALERAKPLDILLGLFVLRFALTMLCYPVGAPGGIFAPMLALGTLWGVFFGEAASRLLPGASVPANAFAVAGMGALFAATVRAPLTGMVLILEMTANYSLTLPLMVSCIAAAVTAEALGARPVYRVLLERALSSPAPGCPNLSPPAPSTLIN